MKTHAALVREDLKAIQARAMTLYALAGNEIPWPLVSFMIRDEYEAQAEQELWEEGVLHFDFHDPLYE